MYRLPKHVENKYRFVTLAALRAEQLQMGARPKVESTHQKATIVAQEEVAGGLVELYDPERSEIDADVVEVEEDA